MTQSATRSRTPRSATAGFSMAELVVSICVMLVLTAMAIPSLMRSLRAYQLNDAAAHLSDMLKFTRYEAVRRNTQVSFLMKATADGWLVGTDSNNDGVFQTSEKQLLISGFAALLPSGGTVPPPGAITAALGGAGLTALSGANGTLTFDARGAIRTAIGGAVSANVYVFYIGSINDPDPGYRAVVLLPSGTTQIWSAPSGGPWHQVS